MTSERRGLHGVYRIITTFALAAGLLVPLTLDARASVPQPCGVKNLRNGRSHRGTGSNLQTAIDAAGPGSHLRIRGLCRGTFSIDRSLTLIGEGNAAYPAATLNGRRAGTVLTIRGAATKVSLESLTLTRGAGEPSSLGMIGGGIENRGILTLMDSTITRNEGYIFGGGILSTGALTLNGSSTVTHNHVEGGGAGIANFRGTLTLNDASSVSSNENDGYGGAGIYTRNGTIVMNDSSVIAGNTNATGPGGGLSSYHGMVTMNGSSSVRENRTLEGGGAGIFNAQHSVLTLNDSSSVSSNVVAKSGYTGGGILNYWGLITLGGSSSVTGNATAGGFGGGINTVGAAGNVSACTTWTGAISPNSPDDPPPVTPISC